MNPRTPDELLTTATAPLLSVRGTFAHHAPSAQTLEVHENLAERRRCPTPERMVSARCHDP